MTDASNAEHASKGYIRSLSFPPLCTVDLFTHAGGFCHVNRPLCTRTACPSVREVLRDNLFSADSDNGIATLFLSFLCPSCLFADPKRAQHLARVGYSSADANDGAFFPAIIKASDAIPRRQRPPELNIVTAVKSVGLQRVFHVLCILHLCQRR